MKLRSGIFVSCVIDSILAEFHKFISYSKDVKGTISIISEQASCFHFHSSHQTSDFLVYLIFDSIN